MIEPYTQKIFFVDNELLADLKQDSIVEYKHFIAPQIDSKLIVIPDLSAQQIGELVAYVPPTEIRVGNVLAKTGYTNQFGPLDAFADDHAIRKFRIWVQLCIALGAKKVAVNNIEKVHVQSQDQFDIDLTGGLKAPIGSADIEFKRKSSEEEKAVSEKILSLAAEATGGEPNLSAAEEILTLYDLHKDDMFRSMYEMRRITSNRLLKHDFMLDLTQDMKRMFDASTKAKLKVMSKICKGGGIDASVVNKSLEKSQTALKLVIGVEF